MSKTITKNPDKPLTLKQRKFVYYYLQTGNATESARLAGYADNDQSTIGTMAWDNLQNPAIKKQINLLLTKVKITPDTVLTRLDKIADTSEKDSDRLKALELLGKHLHLFGDNQVNNYSQINISLGDTPVQDKAIDTQ